MDHSLTNSGYGVRLRPVKKGDAAAIVDLRRLPQLSRFIGDTSGDVNAQILWLDRYLDRQGDYYFTATSCKNPDLILGTLAIYAVDEVARDAEWGRWVFRPDTLAATTSVLLLYQLAFEHLQLDSLYCRTLEDNLAVLRFHDQCGLIRERIDSAGITIAGQTRDLVVQRLTRPDWPRVKQYLEKYAMKVESLI